MSEKAKWVESLWGFTNLNFELNLKVSAFYLEKQKSFIPKKKYFLSRTAKVHPKDGVSCLNFPEGFEYNHLKSQDYKVALFLPIQVIIGAKITSWSDFYLFK